MMVLKPAFCTLNAQKRIADRWWMQWQFRALETVADGGWITFDGAVGE
jgi:hypothetical protein